MLSDREEEAARLGMEALDGALVDLGYLPLSGNVHFHVADCAALPVPPLMHSGCGAADAFGTIPESRSMRAPVSENLRTWCQTVTGAETASSGQRAHQAERREVRCAAADRPRLLMRTTRCLA